MSKAKQLLRTARHTFRQIGRVAFPARQPFTSPPYGFIGSYTSWEEAANASTGYDSDVILEKTKTALLQVKNGEAVYERDSVLFDEIQYSWPLLAGLMWIAAQSGGKLNVLDFGGSLGTTYFQNLKFLNSLPEVRWNIVEQPKYVITGKTYFENSHLKFYDGIETCLLDTLPSVVILSGVLPYVEEPYELLEKILNLAFDYVIIDRTPFQKGKTDRLCVQKVPPSIFEGSYPAWIFSLEKFLTFFAHCVIVAEFEGFESGNDSYGCDFKGFIIGIREEHRS